MHIRPQQMTWHLIGLAALASSIGSADAQNIAAGERKYGICIACHGIDERSFKVHYPILAGQSAPYILRALNDFKHSRRSDPNMGDIAAKLSETDMRDLAAFFASLKPYSSPVESDRGKAIRGEKKADGAQCAACHLGGADPGISESPRIQGQHRDYLVKRLQDFRAGRRANDSGVMQRLAQSMTDAGIEDLGNYFAGMRADSRQRKRR